MNNTNTKKWILSLSALVALGLLAIAIAISPGVSLAQGQGGNDSPQSQDEYTSPLVIPAADFSSDGVVPDGSTFWFNLGYIEGPVGGTPPSDPVCLVAPAYLPNGATVTSLNAYVYDNDPAYNLDVGMYRINNTTISPTGSDEIAFDYTEGSSTIIQQLNPEINSDYATIIYPDYSYYTFACLESNFTHLYSVQIHYTP